MSGRHLKREKTMVFSERFRNIYVNVPPTSQPTPYPDNKVTNTKYTALNFVPKNLSEQFSQNMNRYFLMIACLQLIREITPVNPASTWLPLITVLALSALKEGLDDIARHKRDKQINERLVTVIQNGEERQVASMNIRVGDLVCVKENEQAPCDLCLITSSNSSGSCYIQTSNLDGESDYKQRFALEKVQKLIAPSADTATDNQVDEDLSSSNAKSADLLNSIKSKLKTFKGWVVCAHPNADLYEFDAQLRDVPSLEPESLSSKQLIQQSSVLRYTEFIWGIAVYTGHDTKLGKNKHKPKMKWTSAEMFINQLSLFVFLFQLLTVFVFGFIGSFRLSFASSVWYLNMEPEDWQWYQFLVVPARFLLLCSMMIPISLKVTLDFVRAFYAKLIDWDEEMYDKTTKRYAIAANTSISEDLGQMEIILTDKTGTLTENIMLFKKCMVVQLEHPQPFVATYSDGLEDQNLVKEVKNSDSNVQSFFRALALCHTVTAQLQEEGKYEYRSSSPDEEALVKAAAHFGVHFKSRHKNKITIDVAGHSEEYDVLHTLQFTSDRKRMSVLVQNTKDHSIQLISKGADDAILGLVTGVESQPDDIPHVPERTTRVLADIRSGLEQFAGQGLRTLCVAFRTVSDTTYADFSQKFERVNREIDERDRKLAELYEMLENNLTILGVTAIEDKLQEGVPETIQALRDAGLKFWMLTGDKYSTALQVAIACNLHAHENTNLISIKTEDDIDDALASRPAKGSESKTTLIVTSAALRAILLNKRNNWRQKFSELATSVQCVVCCRVTPSQKAQVANLAKESGKKTLAIGDGGNDVNMIQEAHVGVGIDGREGQQAARAADYAIGQFRFLQRLLLVHGHLSYHRTSFIAQYSFYKSLVICFIQLTYATCSSFSGSSLFNSLSLMGYNVFYTGLLACFYAFDLDVQPEKLMNDSSLYSKLQSNALLNSRTFSWWFLRAFYQSLVVYFLTTGLIGSNAHMASDTGHVFGDEEISLVAFTSLIWIQILTIVLESNTIVQPNVLVLTGTLGGFYILNMGFSLVPRLSMWGLMFHIMSDPAVWMTEIVTVVTALLPVLWLKMKSSDPAKQPLAKLDHQTSVELGTLTGK